MGRPASTWVSTGTRMLATGRLVRMPRTKETTKGTRAVTVASKLVIKVMSRVRRLALLSEASTPESKLTMSAMGSVESKLVSRLATKETMPVVSRRLVTRPSTVPTKPVAVPSKLSRGPVAPPASRPAAFAPMAAASTSSANDGMNLAFILTR